MLRTASLVGVLVGVLAGCGGAPERAPAWPKPSPSETDGGESLAPRQPSSVAAIEEAGDATPAAAAAPATAAGATPAAAPAKADKPAAEAPSPREPDVLTTEDIIIEIDD